MFCYEDRLCKEDTSDKLVAMNIFRVGSNLLHARKCSECLVVAFEERYSVVWTKKLRRNGSKLVFSKNEEHRLK